MNENLQKQEKLLLWGVALLCLACLALPDWQQDQAYHRFADGRQLLGLNGAADVLSSLVLVGAGAFALAKLVADRLYFFSAALKVSAFVFCAGILATGLTACWYHLAPDDGRLALGRVGEALAGSGLFAMAVSQRVSERAGLCALVGGIALGCSSVLLWALSGSVMPFTVLQHGLVALGAVVLVFAPARGPGPSWGFLLTLWSLAKLLEANDRPAFELTAYWVSGHTLFHLLMAASVFTVTASLAKARHEGAPEALAIEVSDV
jgi:hypothetical protein